MKLPQPQMLSHCEEWKGKTVEMADWNAYGDILVRFTDGSCCRLKACRGYSGDDEVGMKPLEGWHLRDLGYITAEEYDAYVREVEEERKATSRAYRRQEYERLKKEFETEGKP